MTLTVEEGRSTSSIPHPAGVSIRLLQEAPEFQACVRLQRLIWGKEFRELVPASLLQVLRRTGGIVAGAWAQEEGDRAEMRLVGFLVGLPGWVDGAPVHWSDMLGVDPAFRGRGIGAALKWFQGKVLLARGVESVYWSFDPLEARNARLNLAHLGAQVVEFVPNMYGDSTSPLHQGLDTDRLVVRWDLKAAMDAGPREPRSRSRVRRVIGPSLRIPIPPDIQRLKGRNPAAAGKAQAEVRNAFLQAFEAGFQVTGFLPDIPAYTLAGAPPEDQGG
ncbi:MAG: GNAT family N-acetyltransferase [Gemmatimonadota bacterium]